MVLTPRLHHLRYNNPGDVLNIASRAQCGRPLREAPALFLFNVLYEQPTDHNLPQALRREAIRARRFASESDKNCIQILAWQP